jgi:UDP-N-acetyl-D-glucosamine dehydrogenase
VEQSLDGWKRPRAVPWLVIVVDAAGATAQAGLYVLNRAVDEHGRPLYGYIGPRTPRMWFRDIDDMRESPALDVMLLLQRRGGIVTYSDPHVPRVRLDGFTMDACPQETAADADCVVIVTDHSGFDYSLLVERSRLIVDTRNALKGFRSDKIVRL